MRIILDGNSHLNRAILQGVDHDHGKVVLVDGKQVQVNSALYGVEGFWDRVESDMKKFGAAPRDCIIVWDAPNAKHTRRRTLPGYKEGRSKAPEVAEQVNIAREQITKMAKALGMHVAMQPKLEADDAIGYLCKVLRDERNVILSSDGDLAVLVDENTDIWNGKELNRNPFGPFPHKYITLYKAFVGDTSDKIPGAKGFGDAAFTTLVREVGLDGLDQIIEFFNAGSLNPLEEYIGGTPILKKVWEQKEEVEKCWKVASLMIDEVNTMRNPLELQAGMVAQWSELDDQLKVHGLKEFYGTRTLVTSDNYRDIYTRFHAIVNNSPLIALDIETSSSPESDEWIEQINAMSEKGKGSKIDVLGHELTGLGLTFGNNCQHTIYLSVDHAQTKNITVDQCRELVELIPKSIPIIVQNRQFEFSVLYRTWGDKWKNNGWHGFLPNCLDSKVAASYVDENLKLGLKERSLHHLGYTQATYEQTTCKSGPASLMKGGKVIKQFSQDGMPWETRQYKMRELTAKEVLNYGADDTICTAALMTHYKLVMEIEGTWKTYLDVETLPEYLTSLAFVQGTKISMTTLREMEKADDKRYDEAWATMRAFLLKNGWEGTQCPEFVEPLEPSDVKLAVEIVLGGEFSTRKRKLSGIAEDIRAQYPDSGEVFALAVEQGDVQALNKLVKHKFDGEPKLNLGSPRQVQKLLYEVVGAEPRILNALTEKQRDDAVMASAMYKFKKARSSRNGKPAEYTPDERKALMVKASTDDDAVATALAMDNLDDEKKGVLAAYQTLKSIGTLRSLYYKPYKALPHWRDGLLHPSLNQAGTVTRRHSSSSPNVQQLVKGAGGFREVFVPPEKDWVICSLDLAGQELRLAAEASGDTAMTSCYVGDNLKDMHHLTAVASAPLIWKQKVTYEEFVAMLESDDPEVKKRAKALRANAKTVNFATAYGAMAPKIALTLMTNEATAQAFIDAKEMAFPRLPQWSKEVQEQSNETGYALTMLGARRHLASGLTAENKWDRAKAGRQVGNFVIQGSGGEMLRLALASMWRKGLFTGRFRARFIAPIHDEVVCSVHRDDLIPLLKELHPCMTQQYAKMKIPLESSISIGLTFGTQTELGTTIDEAKINSALKELFA